MANPKSNNKQWKKIFTFLKQEQKKRRVYIQDEAECRKFLEGLLWIARSGSQWRFLPEEYGNWNPVYKRFSRWEKQGVFERMSQHFSEDHSLESLMLDSTVVRAHMCAAGALKKMAVNKSRPSDVLGVVSAQRSMSWLIPMACR